MFRPSYSAFRPPRLDPPGDDRSLPRRGSQSEGGFTLIEVMMAATILVVGFIGMIQAVSLTSGMMDHARRQILATQILNHEIEKLRLVGWSNGSTGINDLAAGPTTVTIDSQFSTDVAASGATYTLSRSVADVVTGSMREVTFTVTWVVTTSRLKPDGSLFTLTYTRVGSAYFGKYGLNLTYQRS